MNNIWASHIGAIEQGTLQQDSSIFRTMDYFAPCTLNLLLVSCFLFLVSCFLTPSYTPYFLSNFLTSSLIASSSFFEVFLLPNNCISRLLAEPL
jgi:hypothetical protein